LSISSASHQPRTLRALAAPVAWSVYILAPASGWGWLDGIPLEWHEAGALTLVWWTWAGARRLPATRICIALAVAKLALGGVFVERGLAARYYANDSWTAPAERSIDFRGEPFTRRDDRVAFDPDRGPHLPLHFFNDLRFNFYRSEEPERERLAYSVEWTGVLAGDSDAAERVFYLDAGTDVSSSLSIDGRPLLTLDTRSRRSDPVRLESGWHALTVMVSAPYGASRRIEAGEIVDGMRQPFDGDRVYLHPAGSVRLTVDTALRWITKLIDVAVVSWLAWLGLSFLVRTTPVRRIAALLWLGGFVEALLFAYPYVGRLVLIRGGDDWLAYESYARAIALGDVIRAGLDGPFYYQALYPYFVALTHLVFGEEHFAVVFAQRALLVATIGWTAQTTRLLFGAGAGWIAALAGGAFLYAKVGRWTTVVLAEPFFIPLLVGWVALLVKAALDEPSRSRVVAAGIVGGVATLARTTLLLAWPPTLLLWWASLRNRRGHADAVVTLVVIMLGVVALLSVRNWMVTSRWIPLPTSFAVNVHLGNTPTRPLDPAPPARQAIYDRLGLAPQVRVVSEFAIQAPDDFARGLANKALYTVGLMGWSGLPGGSGIAQLYVGAWLLALLGAVRTFRAPVPLSPVVWLPATGALSHAAAVVLIFPHGYTDRLILPLYPLLIPYAAYALEPLLQVIPRAATRLGVFVAVAADATRGWTGRHLTPRIRRLLQRRRNWLYLAYTAAAVFGPEPVAALVLPAAAFTVSRLTARERVHVSVGSGLWALALVRTAAAGSQSAAALTDPLFWGLLAVLALGVSAVAGRWPVGAVTAAALAGAFTTVATLLPLIPDCESSLPRADLATFRESMVALAQQFGPVGALCLVGLWIQAILTGGARGAMGRLAGAARAALAASLVLALAGAVPGAAVDVRVWLLVLGTLVGLVEAKAPQARSTPGAP
jgi:hypothetical protein